MSNQTNTRRDHLVTRGVLDPSRPNAKVAAFLANVDQDLPSESMNPAQERFLRGALVDVLGGYNQAGYDTARQQVVYRAAAVTLSGLNQGEGDVARALYDAVTILA